MLAWLDMYHRLADRAVKRADAVLARAPDSEEVKFFRADFAYVFDANDLARWVEPLMPRSASNRGWVPVSHRLKYAHVLRKRGESANASALVDQADRIARAALDAQPDATDLRVELAAVAAFREDTTAALEWLQRAYDGGYRNFSFLEHDPILQRQMGTDPRFLAFMDRMRSDVTAQRERAAARGLLDLRSLLAAAE
jgi:hypothetical protein